MIKALINRLGLFPDSPNGNGTPPPPVEVKQVDFLQFGSEVVELLGGASVNADRLTRGIAFAKIGRAHV